MFKPVHTAAVAAALTVFFGTAAGIAAIGSTSWVEPQTQDIGRIGGVASAADEAPALASCSVMLVVGQSADASTSDIVEVTLSARETIDLDTPDQAGFSVVCGEGPVGSAPAMTAVEEVNLMKADLAAL
ncbi:hypothetical protein [Chthonobacter albigriseus]|uniref:hypothetical protein n=1 Tax=Chthonobacter albigriseus TaxID=1683161 RepID=UPI0015EF4ACC|nr:hypothetical protein [Chthonobacter albigriseus]